MSDQAFRETFVLRHDSGTFGPFDSREAAVTYAQERLNIDPHAIYEYQVWPMTSPDEERR